MDFRDSPEVAAFRAEVREFLATEAPPSLVGTLQLISTGERDATMREWEQRVARRGWMAPAWPKEYGGAGLSVVEQYVLAEEFALARIPHPATGVGVSLVGPTIIMHGTEEQRAQHLPGILDGSVVWCQGFSEPGAGSDLASLTTQAVRDGDDYVVTGQKIWTSWARFAQWMILLVRTDPTAAKHRGITYLLTPMDAPGITIRPLTQMTGESAFNEVFLDQVRVPVSNRLGNENEGWYIATTTLDFERSNVLLTVSALQTVEELVASARNDPFGISPVARMELADRVIEANVAVQMSRRVVSMQASGLVPNYEASMTKLFASELHQRIAQTAVKLAGLSGQVIEGDSAVHHRYGPVATRLMSAIPVTIGGGTSEIQRNIIATRGLGLPR